jgi:protein farnesyltransferase subunit beta
LQRQTRLEGGFQGRTNKLVDSCYSFWQGGALAIIHMIRTRGHDLSDVEATAASLNSDHAGVEIEVASDGPRIHVARDESGELSFNQKALQQYVLHCAQEFDRGGLKDKPGKSRDYYHRCVYVVPFVHKYVK